MWLNEQCLFIQHVCSMAVQQFFVLMDNLSLYYLNTVITHGIWLLNRNKALGPCKKSNRQLTLQLQHIPITLASEVALRLPKKQLQSSQYGNIIAAAYGQNLLSEELHEYSKICSKTEVGGKKKNLGYSSAHPHKAPWWRPSVWQPSLCLQPRGTLSVPNPPLQTKCHLAPWLATTPAPSPSHSQLGYAFLPSCNAVCRARKWMWHSLCFHSTWWIDIDTRKAKGLGGTHSDETNGSMEKVSSLVRKATVHQAAGSQAGGRKTCESKLPQMHWVTLFQVWAGQLRYAWTQLYLSIQSALWESTKPKLLFQIFIKK